MSDRRWERLAPLTGILAVALWVISALITEGTATTDADTPQQMLAAYRDDTDAILSASFLFMVGCAFFLWFLGSLRAALYRAEGDVGRVTAIAFAGGISTAVCLMLTRGPDMAGAINEDDLTAEVAQGLNVIDEAFFVGAQVSAIVLVLATGLVAVRTGVLPRWLGFVSFVLALWLVIGPIGWLGLLTAFPVWVIVVSVLLWQRAAQPPERETAVTA